MSAAAPWSVKGIDPKAREVAKDLARRSGMTLGEWLNTMIMDDAEEDEPTPLPRRPNLADMFERRGRSRRLDDAYDASDDTLQRVAASVDAIAARLEAAERRSTVAIQGVDQAVSGLVRRLEGQDVQNKTQVRRLDDIAEELREGHRRLRKFEQETGPQVAEGFGKVDTSVAALTSRLYDIEERQRLGAVDLRQRMDAVEKTAGPGVNTDVLTQVGARLDQAQAATSEALRGLERSFAGLDQRLRTAENRVEPEGQREIVRFEKLAETLSRQVETNRSEMMRRLDTAEAEGRMERIERAMAAINDQARVTEQRSAEGIDAMGREVLRIAQNLNGRVEQVDARQQGLDAALKRVDSRFTQAEAVVGRRVTELESSTAEKIARVGQAVAADLSASLNEKIDRDMGRYAQVVEQRLNRTDDQHALALEKLGGEITRISDRLADRIAQSERKSAQALEDIARRLSDGSDRIEQRYERASGELGERMRLSEERTAKLLEEARERLEVRAERPVRETPTASPHPAFTSDWRASAFQDDFNAEADDVWATGSLSEPEPAPFPGQFVEPAASQVVAETFVPERLTQTASIPVEIDEPAFAVQAPTPPVSEPEVSTASVAHDQPVVEATPFGGFGGADVKDALEAIAATTVQAPAQPAEAPAYASPVAFGATPAFDADAGFADDQDDFAGETEFVDARAMRAGLAAGAANGRSASTRNAIDAARAAMTAPVAEAPVKGGFNLGLKRGGKSRLQERLDKQANRDGSTLRKALLASVTGVALVTGVYATVRLTGGDTFTIPGMDQIGQALGLGPARGASDPATPVDQPMLAAVALTPTEAVSADRTEAQTVYDKALEELDGGDKGAVDTLTRAANLGLPEAQLKLAGLYETGANGVTKNASDARLWARRAAEGGDPKGMHAFGMYLFDGVGGVRNRPEALNWLLKAADKGLVDSQYNVARIYEKGDDGIASNPTEALKWYLIAARTGDQQAQTSADRLTATAPAAGRTTARAAADAFKVEPLS